jgi:hypothetical protein
MKQMFLLAAILTCLTLASCSKDKDQTEELPAEISKLIEESNCVCLPYVYLYTWNNKQVYALAYRGITCNWMPSYYNSQGHLIQMSQGYTFDKFLQDSKLVKKIWECTTDPLFQPAQN